MPSGLQGGFGDLAVLGGFGVRNHPGKKVLGCVWGYFGGGAQYAPVQAGSGVEKPWHVCCCYSHDVSGEQALQREVVIETKPSRDGLVDQFAKKIGIG